MSRFWRWLQIPFLLLATTPGAGQLVGTEQGLYYGPGINAESLSNTRIGGPERTAGGWRFLATHTGDLVSFKHYVIWSNDKPGYSGGDGGILLYELRTDDGMSSHLPGNTVLASVTLSNPMSRHNFPTLSWPSPVPLHEGTIYHITCRNIHADPVNNYVSLDNLLVFGSPHPVNPTTLDKNWACMLGSRFGAWTMRDGETPILELRYSDGLRGGQGQMEVWIGNPKPIEGANAIRERFVVSGENKAVSQASVWLRRVSGTGSLTMTLEQSTGKAEETVTVLSGLVSTRYRWVAFPFSAPRLLTQGTTYHLKLTAPVGTVFEAYPLADGSEDYSFDRRTAFSDGLAEYTTGSSWSGWDQWGRVNRKDADLQFYFTLARWLSLPTVLSPAPNAGFAPDSVTLRWSRPPGATSFRIQIARDSLFARMTIDTVVTDTLWRARGYIAPSLYYFRVRAFGVGLSSSFTKTVGFVVRSAVEVEDRGNDRPMAFLLHQNYPNPFNPVTNVHFDLSKGGQATVKVFDCLGREAAIIFDAYLPAGPHSFMWDASGFATGLYFCRLDAEGKSAVIKMHLVR